MTCMFYVQFVGTDSNKEDDTTRRRRRA